jgi:DNA invertase Pin-like site-specific DNA recombinase
MSVSATTASPATVATRNKVKRLTESMGKGRDQRAKIKARVLRGHQQGKSAMELAWEFGIHRSTVYRWIAASSRSR